MKKLMLTTILLLTFLGIKAQDYDLIVTSDKDSLACRIDSITDSHIYFEMRHNSNWIYTMMKKDQIKEFKEDAVDMKYFDFIEETSYIKTRNKKFIEGYQHAHRLMFTPTSYTLKKGDLHYTTNYLLIHNLQVGITDHISFDFGTSIYAIPIYSMLNLSFPVSENLAFTVGDLLVFNLLFDQGVMGNLAYGMVSLGKKSKNLNIGAGHLYLTDDFYKKTSAPAITLSGQLKIGTRAYLLTEHYWTVVNAKFWPDYGYDASMEDYIHQKMFIAGMTGIRLLSRKNPLRCWNFGFGDILLIDDDKIPDIYNNTETENHLQDGKTLFRLVPIISFSWKFGKNYK